MFACFQVLSTHGLLLFIQNHNRLRTISWIRITHSGGGVPEELLNQMFGSDGDASEEGMSLFISRKLLKLMNGDVRYLREAGKATFIISVELAVAHKLKT